MPKLSIITINYNNAKGLDKTIKSVIAQSFRDFEFIIVDGGSSDNSVEIIKQFAGKINYWVSEKDNGIYDAQNKGIDVARGEYCLFLNSGDYLLKDTVLQNVFNNPKMADIMACDMIFDYGEKKIEKRQPDGISKYYMIKTSIWHPATFIKRSLFQRLGKYNLLYRTAADYDFFLNAIIKNKAVYFHQKVVLSVFDTGGTSSSIENVNERKAERLAIQKQYFPYSLILLYSTANRIFNLILSVIGEI